MVKTATEVAEKMRERVGTAGKYLKQGMEGAVDPLDVLNKNPEESKKKWQAGIAESARKGSYEQGIKRAKENDSWRKSQDRAAAHFEERKDDMVINSMKDYDKRAAAIETAQKAVAGMPTTTRAQRIAKSAAYQTKVGEEMDKIYGRKA